MRTPMDLMYLGKDVVAVYPLDDGGVTLRTLTRGENWVLNHMDALDYIRQSMEDLSFDEIINLIIDAKDSEEAADKLL